MYLKRLGVEKAFAKMKSLFALVYQNTKEQSKKYFI